MSPLLPQSTDQAALQANPLYESRKKIHPKPVKGFYRSLKNSFMWIMMVVYHLTPWLPWDRGVGRPDQAILIDISGGRVYLFNLEIWPQDIYILTGLMILAAVGLFLSASLIGRAWCGFMCFQTVWTDLFMKVESWVEGDRNARIRLDAQPMGLSKFFKRVAKHSIWLLIAAFVALSFLWYFDDAAQVTKDFLHGDLSGWTLAVFGTILAMTYLMAGFAREQVCTYMCPYGRFQGVMFDQHSKVITYQDWRGEPRGKAAHNTDFSNRGACIDCSLCVQVCPTGVDIREGQQMDCIGCGLCIDACDNVMEKLNLPKKLICYDSAHAIQERSKGREVRSPLLRIRVFFYMAVLLATFAAMVVSVNMRPETTVSVYRDRAPFYVTLTTGEVQNAYTVRIINKSKMEKTYRLVPTGAADFDSKIIGYPEGNILVESGKVASLRVIVKAHISQTQQPLTFNVQSLEGKTITSIDTVFIGPDQ
ncbi:MAG: cytochrome c oxidase accessory protein CcoG [Methylocystaceae bacterium]|nr:cytochrome c oxidase accessory protein CcoG [Methylocystaceae bacterium]